MGNLLSEYITETLRDAIPAFYPSINLNNDTDYEGQFNMDLTDASRETWKIINYNLGFSVTCPRVFFERLDQSVANWYRDVIDAQGVYATVYSTVLAPGEVGCPNVSDDLDSDTESNIGKAMDVQGSESLPDLASISGQDVDDNSDIYMRTDDEYEAVDSMPDLQSVSSSAHTENRHDEPPDDGDSMPDLQSVSARAANRPGYGYGRLKNGTKMAPPVHETGRYALEVNCHRFGYGCHTAAHGRLTGF